MNTEKYERVTLVLDLDTAKGLRFVSKAVGVSVSELTRGLLEQPVSLMRDGLRAASTGDPADRAEVLQNLDLFVSDALADLHNYRGQL